jgi:hypothetical protein
MFDYDAAFTISEWLARVAKPNDVLMIEGLRKAGLPELTVFARAAHVQARPMLP